MPTWQQQVNAAVTFQPQPMVMYGHVAAAAADAIPATSATTTANGNFWRCVRAGQPGGNVWNG